MDHYLIDSHCHLHNTEDFDSTPKELISRAHNNQVRQMIVIGTSHIDSLAAQTFAAAHEDVFWTYGIHPSEAEHTVNHAPFTADKKLLAIGEVGLDYHYQPFNREQQIKLLEQMLALAKKHDLPITFHVREAFDDFFPIIDNQHIKKAVIHSFSDNQKHLEEVLDRGFYVGVNGLATFAKIPLPPLQNILLETDAPYLTPVPFRGKINESAYIKNIADYLSLKLGVTPEKIAEETTKNVQNLFRIPSPVVRPA